MKTLQIASVLALSALCAVACSDDDDDTAPASGGKGGVAGSSGGTGKGGKGGMGGSTAGNASHQAGAPTETGGAGGEPTSGTGGAAAGAGEGGSTAGGEGGATPFVCIDASAGGAGGQGGAGGDGPGAGLEIIGTWKESFGGDLEISSSRWNDSFIEAYDNAKNVVYAQTPCDSPYFPGNFSKYVYLEPTGDSFYYCTVVYDAKTLAEARASTKTADADDLETGCNGFPWSEVTKP